ncbi:MAG: carboxypeptidase regulatory-like domain-containing protein, partial [Phycisphaerales bacterium]|nr:carboxypeptidase regulatory-like domain-containing protein [Phycisphaerales bacterium]
LLRLAKETRYRLVDPQGRGIAGVVTDGSRRIETDPDGRFICDSRLARHRIIAWDRQRKLAKAFVPDKQLPADIQLEPTAEIHGKLAIPPGRKLEEVKLELHQIIRISNDREWGISGGFHQTHIGPCGKFRITSIPVGLDVRLSPVLKGVDTSELRDSMQLKPGESRSVGLIDLTNDTRTWDATVTGRVVDEHGQPVASQNVFVYVPGASIKAITDHNGRFELKGLAQDPVTLHVRRHNYSEGRFNLHAPGTDVKCQIFPAGW